MNANECLHATLKKLAENEPANELHKGPERAYYCHGCGSIFFPTLIPAKIKVSYPNSAAPTGEGK